MIRQKYKDYLYDFLFLVTYSNYLRYKWQRKLLRGLTDAPIRVNIGSGGMYIAGFVNIEMDPFQRKDIWLDVRHGLPFYDGEVSIIFICHLIEHMDWESVQFLFRECRRILKPGGVIRIASPSLSKAIGAYTTSDMAYFPQEVPGKTAGKRFSLYMTYFCQHRLMFDFGFIRECLTEAGFNDVAECAYRKSHFLSQELVMRTDWDSEELRARSLFVEAIA